MACCQVFSKKNFFFHLSGKDKIIFVTKEDHETPSNAELVEEDPNDPYEEQGESVSGRVSPN